MAIHTTRTKEVELAAISNCESGQLRGCSAAATGHLSLSRRYFLPYYPGQVGGAARSSSSPH
eukprot:scaffold11508_cov140-Skeletonema_menzelii.AAC.1